MQGACPVFLVIVTSPNNLSRIPRNRMDKTAIWDNLTVFRWNLTSAGCAGSRRRHPAGAKRATKSIQNRLPLPCVVRVRGNPHLRLFRTEDAARLLPSDQQYPAFDARRTLVRVSTVPQKCFRSFFVDLSVFLRASYVQQWFLFPVPDSIDFGYPLVRMDISVRITPSILRRMPRSMRTLAADEAAGSNDPAGFRGFAYRRHGRARLGCRHQG